MTCSRHETLTLALNAAVTARRTSLPSQLLCGHGSFIFVLSLAALPSRKIIEVLFMLTPAERAYVYQRLPYYDRNRLAQIGMVNPNEPASARLHGPTARLAIFALRRVGKLTLSSPSSSPVRMGAQR